MSYKCLECGNIFEDGEEAVWSENRGEYWGSPCYEKTTGCPICGGAYEKTVPCAICGSAHLANELNGDVCDECIDEYRKDFDTCYKVCDDKSTEIEINALLASLFDVSDIEAILYHYVKEKCPDIDCGSFINEDISWFGERLAKEVNKNENEKDKS